ncbi:MAG TPA: sn-glycerol-3-phosphate ABC transporter ATP-binding protein UgpC, partial [Anaeromyxobacteraceae bacterium]|nr:sn-glycerol-3-phosphate ABC transporter ATP-binding protein UgpC [Anaeromyxobacteraceae bacterium]
IRDGELMVLVGPSGCGKSTALRMIAGLEDATSGEIAIGGRVVNDVPPRDRDVAMVFQSYALYPHMTVRENLEFGLRIRKTPAPELDRLVREAAQLLGIDALLHRKPRELSGGQRQRVALGRAIVRKPAVFLFDEPLSNLDAKLRVQMRTEIARLHHRLDATMVYVTHDQTEAMTMGDRIVVLKDGVIQQIDTPLSLYDHPANQFVAGFIGSPAMNFIPGELDAAGTTFHAKGNAFTLPLLPAQAARLRTHAGRPVTVGVRPEDLYVAGGPAAPAGAERTTWQLDVLEPMGNEVFVYASRGFNGSGHRAVARVAPQALPEPGRPIDLAFDLTKLHFFDAETEAALGPEAPAPPPAPRPAPSA